MVWGVDEQSITWEKFQRCFKEKYLTKRLCDEKSKEFHDLRLGKMSMDEFLIKFTSLLRYVTYRREEKAKVQQFISSFPLFMKEQLEFDNPKTMDEVIRKARIFYLQNRPKGDINKKWNDKKGNKFVSNQRGNKGKAGTQEKPGKDGVELASRPSVQCLGCGGPHHIKNCPQRRGANQIFQLQEASTVGDVARSLPKINASLEDIQAEFQPTMIEFEGKILDQAVSILIDPRATLSYISPNIVVQCKLHTEKFKNSWLV
eukprot:PITA_23957